jgi:hypothetical protein
VTSVSSVSSQNTIDDARTGANKQCLLVQAEIWRVISEAARKNASLSLSRQAQRIASTFPESGYSRADIADALVFAAVDEGVVLDAVPTARAEVPFIEVKSLLRAAGRLRTRRGGRAKKQLQNGEAALQAIA